MKWRNSSGPFPGMLIGHSKGYALRGSSTHPRPRGISHPRPVRRQRTLHVGYRGTQLLLDRIVNAIIENDQEHSPVGYDLHVRKESTMNASPNPNLHPCFNAEAKGLYGRVHLPVAPHCNIKCNYCNRKYDCVNESRPGDERGALPMQACRYVEQVIEREPRIPWWGNRGRATVRQHGGDPGDPAPHQAEVPAPAHVPVDQRARADGPSGRHPRR